MRKPVMPATETELLDLVAHESGVERVKLVREAVLADLGVTSIELITLLFEIEDRYGVAIEESELPEMTTVGEMSDFLLSRLNTAASA